MIILLLRLESGRFIILYERYESVMYEVNNNITTDKNKLQFNFKTTIIENDKENPLEIEVLAVGVFATIDGNGNLSLDEFCRFHAPSVLSS